MLLYFGNKFSNYMVLFDSKITNYKCTKVSKVVKPTNKKTVFIYIVYYKTLGTSVINSPSLSLSGHITKSITFGGFLPRPPGCLFLLGRFLEHRYFLRS